MTLVNDAAANAADEIADRIENGPGLFKGFYYKMPEAGQGPDGHITGVYQRGDLPMCSAGYIIGATATDFDARSVLFATLQAVIGPVPIVEWNDRRDRTEEEVAEAFKQAAQRLRT